MTNFKDKSWRCSRNAQDLKVLLVGLVFTALIYTGVSALETVDLLLHK